MLSWLVAFSDKTDYCYTKLGVIIFLLVISSVNIIQETGLIYLLLYINTGLFRKNFTIFSPFIQAKYAQAFARNFAQSNKLERIRFNKRNERLLAFVLLLESEI